MSSANKRKREVTHVKRRPGLSLVLVDQVMSLHVSLETQPDPREGRGKLFRAAARGGERKLDEEKSKTSAFIAEEKTRGLLL